MITVLSYVAACLGLGAVIGFLVLAIMFLYRVGRAMWTAPDKDFI